MSLQPPKNTHFNEIDEWPTNVTTIVCTAINGILLIVIILTYILLCKKSCEHKEIEDEVNHPNSRKNSAKLRNNTLHSQRADTMHVPINSFVFWGTLISCSFFLLSNIFTMLYTINSQYYICCARLITYIQIITIGVAKLLCHLIFVRRLYITFNNSRALRYPDWIFYSIYVSMFLGFCLIIGIVIIMSTLHIANFIYIATSLFSIDFMASVVILILFIKKLHKVFIQRKRHSVKDVTKPIQFAEVDKQLMRTMTKLTLLSSFSALSALCLIILFVIRAIKANHGTEESNEFQWKIVYTTNVFFMLTGVINCMVEYFTLNFAKKHYDKMCTHLHNKVATCCGSGIKKKLHKDRQKWIRQSLDMNASKSEMTDVSNQKYQE